MLFFWETYPVGRANFSISYVLITRKISVFTLNSEQVQVTLQFEGLKS